MDSSKYLAALTLVGLVMAGSNSLADELIVVASANKAQTTETIAAEDRAETDIAREATLAATRQAVDALLSATKKDLDILFIATTSEDVTGGR